MRILKSHPLLKLVNSYIIDSPQPSNISYLWNFGSLLGTCLIIQIITGVTLAMHYNPNVLEAFNSVEHIMRDVNNGWLIRYLHSNAASAFFFIVYLHIGRGLYYGSYKAPRTLVWSIGTVIFILMMATAFLGYVLPYGQMSLWGATVITNLMSAIPWVGQDIVEFIWGGFSVNNATLNRFFALHFVLPFILAALALMHLIVLHDSAGSGNPLGVSGNSDRLPFAPYYIFKDLVTIFILIIALSILVFFMPNALGDSENYVMANPMQTPPAIVPEWYLLPFYAILRSIPNKLLGVIAMFSAILALLAMPFVDMSKLRGLQFRPLSRIAFFIFVGNFLILMILGAKHVESPYIELGQISTAIYFAHFFVVMPLVSTLENSLTDVFAKNSNKAITSETFSNKINNAISVASSNLLNTNNSLINIKNNMKNNIVTNKLSRSNFSTLKKSESTSNYLKHNKNKPSYYSILLLLLIIILIINIIIFYNNITLEDVMSYKIENDNNIFIIDDIIETFFGLFSLLWLTITSLFTSYFDNSDYQNKDIINNKNDINDIANTFSKNDTCIYNREDDTSSISITLEMGDNYANSTDTHFDPSSVYFAKIVGDSGGNKDNNDDVADTTNNNNNNNTNIQSSVDNQLKKDSESDSHNGNPNKRKLDTSSQESEYNSDEYMGNWNHYYEELDKKDNKRQKIVEYDERSIISSEIHDDDSEKTKLEKNRLKELDDALKAEKVVFDAEMAEQDVKEQTDLFDLETLNVLAAMEASKVSAREEYLKNINKSLEDDDKSKESMDRIESFVYGTKGPAPGEAGPSNWYKNTTNSVDASSSAPAPASESVPLSTSVPRSDDSGDPESDPEISTRNKGKKPAR